MPSLVGSIQRQAGRKLLLASFSITNSAALYAIPTTTAEFGRAIPRVDLMLMLQGNTDFFYRLSKGAAAAASATTTMRVMAWQQELTSREPDDNNFDIVTAAGTGIVNVFILLPGN